jgi:putative redox protein
MIGLRALRGKRNVTDAGERTRNPFPARCLSIGGGGAFHRLRTALRRIDREAPMPVTTATRTEIEMTQQDRPAPAVAVRTADGYRTEVAVRHHRFIADEPVDKGGTDEGPTPNELMIAALAACTSVTMRMYADRKQWPLRAIDVRAWHRRVDETDPADPDARPRRIDVFDLALTIDGDLDDEQRARLLEIAGRCPVKRALDGSARVVTILE